MSAREQRLTELITARDRLDAQIRRMGKPEPKPVAWQTPPPIEPGDMRPADVARYAIWAGWTHAQVAASLGIDVCDVTTLIALHADERRAAA